MRKRVHMNEISDISCFIVPEYMEIIPLYALDTMYIEFMLVYCVSHIPMGVNHGYCTLNVSCVYENAPFSLSYVDRVPVSLMTF